MGVLRVIFRSYAAGGPDIPEQDLVGMKTNLPRIQRSTITDAEYCRTLAAFEKYPEPPGVLLKWVCRDKAEYLDLTKNRLDLNPAQP